METLVSTGDKSDTDFFGGYLLKLWDVRSQITVAERAHSLSDENARCGVVRLSESPAGRWDLRLR